MLFTRSIKPTSDNNQEINMEKTVIPKPTRGHSFIEEVDKDVISVFSAFLTANKIQPPEADGDLIFDLLFAIWGQGNVTREDMATLLARWFKRHRIVTVKSHGR